MELGRRAFLLSAGVMLTLPLTARLLHISERPIPKALTLDFRPDQKLRVVLTEDVETVNIIAPGTGHFVLMFNQDEVGGHAVDGWPDSVLWLGGAPPRMDDPADAYRIVSFFYDADDGHHYAQSGGPYG